MIKATGRGLNGEKVLYLGLSYGNLDRFRAKPLDTFIRIDAKELGLSHDVLIFSGKTEADCVELLASGFGPGTEVTISPRSKN